MYPIGTSGREINDGIGSLDSFLKLDDRAGRGRIVPRASYLEGATRTGDFEVSLSGREASTLPKKSCGEAEIAGILRDARLDRLDHKSAAA